VSKEKPKQTSIVSKNKTTGVEKETVAWRGVERFWTDSTKKGWLSVGGQWIAIAPDTLYASAYGPHPKLPLDTDPPEPKMTYENSAYSEIYSQISKDSGGSVKDAATAQEIRKYLKGQDTTGTLKILPLLTSVLFVSEVARNHTAFHTNLMVLDLVEKAYASPGPHRSATT
jgi:hypothetical protein